MIKRWSEVVQPDDAVPKLMIKLFLSGSVCWLPPSPPWPRPLRSTDIRDTATAIRKSKQPVTSPRPAWYIDAYVTHDSHPPDQKMNMSKYRAIVWSNSCRNSFTIVSHTRFCVLLHRFFHIPFHFFCMFQVRVRLRRSHAVRRRVLQDGAQRRTQRTGPVRRTDQGRQHARQVLRRTRQRILQPRARLPQALSYLPQARACLPQAGACLPQARACLPLI